MKGTIRYSINLTRKLRIFDSIGKTESRIRWMIIRIVMMKVEDKRVVETIDGFIPNFVTRLLGRNTRRTS